MQSAQRLQTLTQSMIRRMTRLANEHQAINLSQGFPDFDPPAEVLQAAIHALTHGTNQYTMTWGNARLRAKIAENYGRWYNMQLNPETDVTITCGVTEGIIASLMGTINKGDPVVIFDPCHENYLPGVTFANGKPIWFRATQL